jgi:hypothetical protein
MEHDLVSRGPLVYRTHIRLHEGAASQRSCRLALLPCNAPSWKNVGITPAVALEVAYWRSPEETLC